MSAVFPKWVNRLPLLIALFALAGAVGAVSFVTYYFSPSYTDVGYAPTQPVPYSHKLHAGTLGIDCRYCHIGVEVSDKAVVPPTQTCMNCHEVIKNASPRMEAVRDSWANEKPIPWVRIHDLPDYAHFSHAVHTNAGVGCVSCHGRIDQMEVVYQAEPLSMGWCLDCHRNPAPHLRPVDEVTNMSYVPLSSDEGQRLMTQNNINPPENCSACHY